MVLMTKWLIDDDIDIGRVMGVGEDDMIILKMTTRWSMMVMTVIRWHDDNFGGDEIEADSGLMVITRPGENKGEHDCYGVVSKE